MSIVYFTDLKKRQYAIPEEVLVQHELPADLPENERLTGLEIDPPDSSGRGGRAEAEGYSWRVREVDNGEALEYVVSPPEAAVDQRPENRVIRAPGATITVTRDEITIRLGARDGRVE